MGRIPVVCGFNEVMSGEALRHLSRGEEMPGGVTALAAGRGGWQRGEVGTNCLGKRRRAFGLGALVAGRLGILLWLCSPRGC